jgi:hypothetical protein
MRAIARFAFGLTAAVAGCGGGSTPTSPSETPVPVAPVAPVTPVTAVTPTPSGYTGRVTNTVTGAPVFGYDATITNGRLLISAPGYVPRETRATLNMVDLIPEGDFDLEFYRQLARNSFEGGMEPLSVLRQAPSFYMEVEGARGLSAAVAAELEAVARRIVPEMTGGLFQVTRWETGPTPRPRQNGWIVIERRDLAGACGSAFVGLTAGQIFLDNDTTCNMQGVMAHEIGHALGFWHVGTEGSMMFPRARASNIADAPTTKERFHAAIAYKRPTGNQDVDVDP